MPSQRPSNQASGVRAGFRSDGDLERHPCQDSTDRSRHQPTAPARPAQRRRAAATPTISRIANSADERHGGESRTGRVRPAGPARTSGVVPRRVRHRSAPLVRTSDSELAQHRGHGHVATTAGHRPRLDRRSVLAVAEPTVEPCGVRVVVLDAESGLRPDRERADRCSSARDHGGAEAETLQQRVDGQLPEQPCLGDRSQIGAAGGHQSTVGSAPTTYSASSVDHQREHLGDRPSGAPTPPDQSRSDRSDGSRSRKRHVDGHPSILAETRPAGSA